MSNEVLDQLILLTPAPVVEVVMDLLDVALDILRRFGDWFGDLTGCYTYN